LAPVENAIITSTDSEHAVRQEFGPVSRWALTPYFAPVRFSPEDQRQLTDLHQRGFVVHVMRTTAWINFLYLTWTMVKRGLPPVRAVVNLRPWLSRPWRKTAQRGAFDVRFTYARRHGGSGLVFLKQSAFGSARGKNTKEDPFPTLVAMARKSDKPVFLVPELFVWEKWNQRIKPGLIDYVFGSPEAPGFLHSLLSFWRNYHRAQFRVGEQIDLQKFIAENPSDSDEVIARKVRGALNHHLAKETRAVFGAPVKMPSRVIEETMRDRVLRRSLDEEAAKAQRKPESVYRQATKNLKQIAAKPHPTIVALVAPFMSWVFNRIYDGIEVDDRGFERAMKAGTKAPLVLVPSHKSHIDYLVLSYVLWQRGYTIPMVAAGANLSFFPLGPIFRRCGAFFLRRSFKGDPIYTAAFKAYLKKLVHEGALQEFFPEGGRSRTGKLLQPKLGLVTWEVEAVLEGAAKDLIFVPVAIDYEKVVESSSYSKELAGGEKKPEDLKALLSAPKVLTARYGRIHLSFDQPVALSELAAARGISLDGEVTAEAKRGLVRALGHRIMYGISRVSTVTPHALLAAALLAHRKRGIGAKELSIRVGLLRRIAEEEGASLSKVLVNAPSDPTVLGPLREAMQTFSTDGMVGVSEAKGEPIYRVEDARRSQLAFYKNTLVNLVAGRSLVAWAVLASPSPSPLLEVKARALFLSRLLKLELTFKVGSNFDALFAETVDRLIRLGLVVMSDAGIQIAPEAHARPQLEFLAELIRDLVEGYLIAALTLEELTPGKLDKKEWVKSALETGRAEFLAGRVSAAESLSRPTVENAHAWLIERGYLAEQEKKLVFGAADAEGRRQLVTELRSFLES
jgi:glycerol-3-phosphate O-acyltransferase